MAKKTQKPIEIDTRKSGPLGYRALQYANQLGYTVPDNLNDYLSQNVDYSYMPENFSSIQATEDKTYTPSQLGVGEDIGSSIFDNNAYNADELANYRDIRAENQSWLAQAAAGITKGAILAGTTFLDGTIGLLDGIYTAIDEGRISGIWDNPVTQAMESINKFAEKALPNYYTSYQENGPWYDPSNLFSANTIFDKFIKNTGFMIGAAYSGGVYTKLLSWGAKGLGALRATGSALKAGTPITKEIMAAGARAMDASNAARATKSVIGSFMNAAAEGTVEAVSNSNDWVTNQKQKYNDIVNEEIQKAQEEYLLTKGNLVPNASGVMVDPAEEKYKKRVEELQKAKDEAFKQIELDRTKMGNADLAFNLPILWAGDFLTFGKMYAGGWKASRNQIKTTTRATKQALADAKAAVKAGDENAIKNLKNVVKKAKETGYQGLTAEEKALVEEVADYGFSFTSPIESIADMAGKKTGMAYRVVRQPLKEGNEEMAQSAAATAAGSYYGDDVDNIYSASIDPDATAKTLDWIKTIGSSIKETYTDVKKYEEGFIGAITGALGSPTFGRKSNSTNQTWLGKNKMFGLTGGIVTDIRDYIKDREDADLTAAHIEKTLKDTNFQNRYKHLVAQTRFDEAKNQAVIHDDAKTYKDAETASIFEDIMYFKKGNRLDLLEKALDNTDLFEEKDIEEIVNMVSSKRSAINDRINEDVNKRNALQAQLEQATQQYEEQFGAEADKKVLEVYKERLKIGGDAARDFYMQYDTAKQEAAQSIEALQFELNQYDEKIKNSKAIEYSPYMKSDGTIMSNDEVREDIKKRADRVRDMIKDISKAQDELDAATGEAYTDDQLATLTWYKVMMRDWEKRASQMSIGLRDFISLVNTNLDKTIGSIDAFLSNADKLGLSRDMVDTYGGIKQAQKKFYERGKYLADILDKLTGIEDWEAIKDKGDARYAIAFAKYLASDMKVPITTKEATEEGEKEETTEVEIGKYLREALNTFIDANPTYSEDQKVPLKKSIEDLTRIGESYSQYNKLLEEFRKNPENIDKAHVEANKKAVKKITNKKAKTIAERFNWDAPIGEIAHLLDENQADIDNMGGLNKFIKALPKDLRDKVKAAQKLRDTINSINDYVDESDLDDNLKNLAKALIEEAAPNAEDLQSLAAAIQDSLNEGAIQKMADALFDQDTDERIKDELLQKSEEELAEFFNATVSKIADALDKIERQNRADEAREEQIKRGKTPEENEPTSDTSIEDGEPDGEHSPEEAEGPKGKKTPKEDEPNAEDSMYQENERTTRAHWSKTNSNKKVTPVSESTRGYEKRRQISEYYLHAVDTLTYLQFLHDNPSYIPDGVDRDAFLRYIEKTHEYLKKAGAFEYVRTQLQEGDKITFITDSQLDTDAGTPVVLMAVESRTEKNENGTPKMQVIGSIRSALDFDAYDKSVEEDSTKKNKAIEAQRKLYDKVIADKIGADSIDNPSNNPPITTTVKALMAGELPISSQENSLEEIYGDNTPVVGICLNGQVTSGKAAVDSNIVQPSGENGQIYVLLPANNGAYIPALCYSTPINSLADNDWYMQQAVSALRKVATSAANMSTNLQEFKRWIPLKDLHINFVYSLDKVDDKTGKNTTIWNQTDDKDKATAIQIKFIDKEGNKVVRTLTLKNGELQEDSSRNFIRTWTKKLGLTTTINKNKLNDEEYIKHMAKYIHTNLVAGEFGQHTRDDWFTYNPTDIEEKYENQGRKASPAAPKNNPPKGKPAPATQTITYKGQEYQVSADGSVFLNNSVITDSALAQSVRDALNNTVVGAQVIDLEDRPKSGGNSVFSAYTTSASISGLGGKQPRRGSAKLMEITQENKKEVAATEQQLSQAIQTAKKLFPALSKSGRIVIVNGIINSFDEKGNPVEAFGAFKDGVLYISNKAPKGTAFHEAFHYITDFLLNSEEKNRMFELAKEQYGNLDQLELEEKLAEDFRAYMNGYRKPSLSQRIKMFFRNLANVIFGISKDTQYLDTLFYNIARGNLANRKEQNISSIKFSKSQENEMQSIKDAAIAAGTFMKAPNGKPTNLNERQWLQVRTKAFKDWFGDWENNPQEASKVVDENGEPLVVYHGSPSSEIAVFNKSKSSGAKKSLEDLNVTFLTDNQANAETYKDISGEGSIYDLFANIKNPLVVDFQSRTWRNEEDRYTVLYNRTFDVLGEFKSKEEAEQWLADNEQSLKEQYGEEFNYISVSKAMQGFKVGNTTDEYVREALKNPNYDGVVFKNIIDYGDVGLDPFAPVVDEMKYLGTDIVAFNPNQIKSATDNIGTFSKTDNNIKFMKADTFKQDLMKHRVQKFSYENLSQEEKDYLQARKIPIEEYKNLSTYQQEILLHCM